MTVADQNTATATSPPTRRRISPAIFLILFSAIMGVTFAIAVILSEGQPASPDTPPSSPFTTLVDSEAPDFELSNLEGEMVRLSDLRGQVVFLNFWATWCEPCRREMPAFDTFMAQDPATRGATILTVDDGEPTEVIQAFFDAFEVENVPVVVDTNSTVRRQYGVVNMPTTFVIDENGIIRALKLGEMTLDDMQGYINAFGDAT